MSKNQVGPSKPTGLVATLDKLAEQMAENRAWMDAKECAAFLGVSYEDFTRFAHQIPRHPLPSARGEGRKPRYRYHAAEVTDWMLGK